MSSSAVRWKVTARKLVYLFITIMLIMAFNFFLFRIMPGDPALSLTGHRGITDEQREQIERAFGLDQPLHIQFVLYVKNTFTGQFGYSWYHPGRLVAEVMMERLPYTLLLIGASTVIAVFVGSIMGVVSAWKRGTKTDVFLTGSGIALYSTPTFWFALIMVMFFAAYLGWFPISGVTTIPPFIDPFQNLMDRLHHMVLPVATYSLICLADFSLIMRDSLVDVLTEDYINTAKAKGLKETSVLRRHAVPNAMLPVITQVAMYIGWIVAGAIMIEIVFTWPGIGLLTYDAAFTRNYPLLQGVFLLITISVVFANFITDIIYSYLDPRVRV